MRSMILTIGLLATLFVSGCGGADPYVIKQVERFKESDVTLMDEIDRLAVKAGEPKLPQAYRDDKTGSKDDLIGYLKGEKPKVGK